MPTLLWPPASYSWPRAIMFYCCSLDLSLFFAAWYPRSLGRSSPNFATCSTVTQVYKIRSEIWVAPSPEIWRPKNIKISATSRLDREYLRNATTHRQSELALQTMDIPAQANLIWCTLVHKRLKIGPELTSDPLTGDSSEDWR